MRISDWSSDVCSSDLKSAPQRRRASTRRRCRSGRPCRRRRRRPCHRDDSCEKPVSFLSFPFRREGQLSWGGRPATPGKLRSEEHTSELQSLMRTSYAVFSLKTKTHTIQGRSSNLQYISL